MPGTRPGDFDFLIGVPFGGLPGFIAGIYYTVTKPLYLTNFGNALDTICVSASLFFGGCAVLKLYQICDPGHGLYNRPAVSTACSLFLAVFSCISFGLMFGGVGVAVADTFKFLFHLLH